MSGHADKGPSRHHEAMALLPWYATGRLPPNEQGRIQRHLAVCPTCQAELSDLRHRAHAAMEIEYLPSRPPGPRSRLLTDANSTSIPPSTTSLDVGGTTPTRLERWHRAWCALGHGMRWAFVAQSLLIAILSAVLVGTLIWR